jgi:hypothetical protein
MKEISRMRQQRNRKSITILGGRDVASPCTVEYQKI